MQTSLNETSNGSTATSLAADQYLLNADGHADLRLAKSIRAEAAEAVAAAVIHVNANRADLRACEAHGAAIKQRRDGAIAANKPHDVIAADGEGQRVSVEREISEAKLAVSVAEHTAAVVVLADATEKVRKAAHAIRCGERSQLAARFVDALDHALQLGEDLEFFTGPHEFLPADVAAALSRLPRRANDLDTPMHILRGGHASQGAWDARLIELMDDDSV